MQRLGGLSILRPLPCMIHISLWPAAWLIYLPPTLCLGTRAGAACLAKLEEAAERKPASLTMT